MLFRTASVALSLALASAFAITTCEVPAGLLASNASNIFSAEREADLGDAIAEQLRNSIQPIDDPALTGYLQKIGDRITSKLGISIPYRFQIVDMPITQAFSLAGGRIYVSRKLIAIAQSEDELAGVLGHEIGHAATHQLAIHFTREFHVLLGVDQVNDRKDVFEKYNQLIESYRRDPEKAAKVKVEKDQLAADRVGLYATAAAGYDPEAEPRIFDRITGTNGDTGNALSNFFNLSSNESRRLRELLHTLPRITAACQTPTAQSAAAFAAWQAEVAEYKSAGHQSDIPGLEASIQLTPPLRSDFRRLRFSPDGSFILALDDYGISVLTHQPLAFSFRIDVPDIKSANFDPTSKFIVLETRTRRIEKWSLESKSRSERREVFSSKTCVSELLATDGRTLACLLPNRDLSVQDVATGDEITVFKGLGISYTLTVVNSSRPSLEPVNPVPRQQVLTGLPNSSSVHLAMSPDSHYLLALGTEPVLFDLTSREKVALPKSARKFLTGSLVFLSPNRVLAFNAAHPLESNILSVPAFEPVSKMEMLPASYEPASKGDYVMLRPFRDYAVAVIDLNEHKVIKGSKAGAFDIYGDEFLTERVSGEVGLFALKSGELHGTVTLPAGAFGRQRAISISDDAKWLAVSNASRGAIWDAATGVVALTSSAFKSASFRADDSLLADVSKLKEIERHLTLLQPALQASQNGPEVTGDYTRLEGPLLVTYKPQSGDKMKVAAEGPLDVTAELSDAVSRKLLWTRNYSEGPNRLSFTRDFSMIVLNWSAQTAFAAQEIKSDPVLRASWDKMDRNRNAVLYLIADARTGETKSRLLIDTGNGSFHPMHEVLINDSLVLSDSSNRCVTYSLHTGEITGRAFGSVIGESVQSNLVAVENGSGSVRVHTLPSMREVAQYRFPSSVLTVSFLPDGKRFLAVAADQKLFRVALPAQ